MDKKWRELYDTAKMVLKPREVSGIIEAGYDYYKNGQDLGEMVIH